MSTSHSGSNNPFLTGGIDRRRCRPSLAPNTELGRFRIVRELGRGNLGDVYLAEDTVRKQEVAIKVVDIGPSTPAAVASQLQRERSLYDRIDDHAHVLKVHDIYMVHWGGSDLLILSMEYADGGSLRTWLEAHRDDMEARRTQGVQYFRQVCQGLAACHAVGIVHLDIKPENALIVGGALKVSDFNIAALVQHLTRGQSALGWSNLEERDFAGTPIYMSPDHLTVAHPEDLDARADIYSLGVILYEILDPEARPPFGGSPHRLFRMHVDVPAPALRGASDAEAYVVCRCLKKTPEERFQTVEELLDALDGRCDPSQDNPETDPGAPQQDDEAWQQVLRAVHEGHLAEGQRLCRQLTASRPDHPEAQSLLDHLDERSQRAERLYGDVERGLDSLPLDELCAMVLEAFNAFPEHPAGNAVQVRLRVKARQYRQWIDEGISAARARDWEGAKFWFEKARELNPGVPEAEKPVRHCEEVLERVRTARDRIDRAIESGDYSYARALARGVDEYLERLANAIRLPERRESHDDQQHSDEAH